MKDTTNLKGLSDSELDDLIMHGINMQENSTRHGNDYQHYLNVVAQAKEEKAKRGGGDGQGNVQTARVAESLPDNKVEDFTAPSKLHIAPQGDPAVAASVEDRGQLVGEGEKPLGVVSDMAKTTPENQGQGNSPNAGKTQDLTAEDKDGEQPRVSTDAIVGKEVASKADKPAPAKSAAKK